MLEMKIFLQVFSVETLSVHFCARCEHNVKHNNLSPVRDRAYLCHTKLPDCEFTDHGIVDVVCVGLHHGLCEARLHHVDHALLRIQHL